MMTKERLQGRIPKMKDSLRRRMKIEQAEAQKAAQKPSRTINVSLRTNIIGAPNIGDGNTGRVVIARQDAPIRQRPESPVDRPA